MRNTVFVISLVAILAAGAWSARAQMIAPPGPDPTPDAKLNEEIVRLPLTIDLPSGVTHKGEFVLTTFRPNGPGPFPAVIVSHGRESRKRAVFGRSRMLAHYWLNRGFAVFAPTRIGHGVSGGTSSVDPEAVSGPCESWSSNRIRRRSGLTSARPSNTRGCRPGSTRTISCWPVLRQAGRARCSPRRIGFLAYVYSSTSRAVSGGACSTRSFRPAIRSWSST